MHGYFTVTSSHAECTWRLYKHETELKETEKRKYIQFIIDVNMDEKLWYWGNTARHRQKISKISKNYHKLAKTHHYLLACL